MLIINFGHSPLRKSSEENQDVARGSDEGEIQFHSTYLPSSLHLLNPCNMFCHTCPALRATHAFQYTLHALPTKITDTALSKSFYSVVQRNTLFKQKGAMFTSLQNNMR